MDRCKCGRPISYRMGGTCMACRYREKMAIKATCPVCGRSFTTDHGRKYCSHECGYEAMKARQKEACRERMMRAPIRRCKKCGAEFQQYRKNYVYCPHCRQKMKYGPVATVGTCVVCGKEYATAQGDLGAKCPACIENEKKRQKGRRGVKRFEPPTYPQSLIQPGGWTGPIRREEDRPVRAKIRIPVDRLPYRGRPTKDKANEQKTEEEKRKAVEAAKWIADAGMW